MEYPTNFSKESLSQYVPERYFGNETEYRALVVEPESIATTDLQSPHLSDVAFEQAFEDVARTLTVISDPKGNQQFEVAFVGQDLDTETYDAEFSTYNSAISSNPANGYEFAENAAVNPERPRIYIASFGNGHSSYLSKAERKHLRDKGSLLRQERSQSGTFHTEALPTVQALQRALVANNITIGRMSANSAGSNLAAALMYESPEGQITHTYVKGRPNLVKHNAVMLGARMLGVENIQSNSKNKELSQDSWKLTDEKNNFAKKELAERIALIGAKGGKLGTLAAVRKLVNDGIAYSSCPRSKDVPSPAAFDSYMALMKQPDAKLTVHATLDDQLYKGTFTGLLELVQYAAKAAEISDGVRGLVTPGSHADHTYTPSVRWAAEQFAFTR